MMCRTAALQVNIDHGDDAEVRAALAAGPPDRSGAVGRLRHVTGRRGRAHGLGVHPAGHLARHRPHPHRRRARRAARTGSTTPSTPTCMLIRRGDAMVPLRERAGVLGLDPRRPRRWARPPPTTSTTTSPPCSRRCGPAGFLEIRYLDALPDPWWRVAVAVTTALLRRPRGRRPGQPRRAPPVADQWCEAARFGLRHPAVHAAAVATRRRGPRRLRPPGRRPSAPPPATTCDRYVERYLGQRRTPGDDVLDAWRRGRAPRRAAPEEDRWT